MDGNSHRVISGTMLVLAWREWGNPRQVSVTTAGLRPEIRVWTKHFPNANTLTAILDGKWSWMISMCRYGYGGDRGLLHDTWTHSEARCQNPQLQQPLPGRNSKAVSLNTSAEGSLIYSCTVDDVRLQITEITYCFVSFTPIPVAKHDCLTMASHSCLSMRDLTQTYWWFKTIIVNTQHKQFSVNSH